MTAALNRRPARPRKASPWSALSRTGRPYRKPRGEGATQTQHSGRNTGGDMLAAGPIYLSIYQSPTSVSSKPPRSAKTLSKSRCWLVDQLGESKKVVPGAGAMKSPSHPWLARPTLAVRSTCTRSAQCQYLINPFSPPLPQTLIDHGRARAGRRIEGRGSQVPLGTCGPPGAPIRVQDGCVTPSVESDTFPVDLLESPGAWLSHPPSNMSRPNLAWPAWVI